MARDRARGENERLFTCTPTRDSSHSDETNRLYAALQRFLRTNPGIHEHAASGRKMSGRQDLLSRSSFPAPSFPGGYEAFRSDFQTEQAGRRQRFRRFRLLSGRNHSASVTTGRRLSPGCSAPLPPHDRHSARTPFPRFRPWRCADRRSRPEVRGSL